MGEKKKGSDHNGELNKVKKIIGSWCKYCYFSFLPPQIEASQ